MQSGFYGSDEARNDNVSTVAVSEDQLNLGSVIVDSGTTDTYMTRALSSEFHKTFKEVAGFAYNEHGMKLSEDEVHKLPTILLQLVGAVGQSAESVLPGHANFVDPEHPTDVLIAIPPAHYVEYDSDTKKYVGRFSTTESRGSVFGANSMRGHDVYFDIPENSRIGFATSDCDYRALIGLDIAIEDKASGHEQNPNDGDYYQESEGLSKMENPGGEDDLNGGDGSGLSPGDLFQSVGVAEVGIVAAVVGAVFAVYKIVSNRRRAQMEAVNLEQEHLKELHLDTEIQMTELA